MGLCMLISHGYRVESAVAIWLFVVCSLPLCFLWLACEMNVENDVNSGFAAWPLGESIKVIRCYLTN